MRTQPPQRTKNPLKPNSQQLKRIESSAKTTVPTPEQKEQSHLQLHLTPLLQRPRICWHSRRHWCTSPPTSRPSAPEHRCYQCWTERREASRSYCWYHFSSGCGTSFWRQREVPLNVLNGVPGAGTAPPAAGGLPNVLGAPVGSRTWLAKFDLGKEETTENANEGWKK